MNRKYDLVVIGAGTAAMGVASRVRAAGWTVAVAHRSRRAVSASS